MFFENLIREWSQNALNVRVYITDAIEKVKVAYFESKESCV